MVAACMRAILAGLDSHSLLLSIMDHNFSDVRWRAQFRNFDIDSFS